MLTIFGIGFFFCIAGILAGNMFNFDFYQNDYDVDFEWIKVEQFNNHTVKQFRVVTFKYNRTTTAFNVTQQYNVELGRDLEILTQAYKFASNEYRLFPPIRYELNYCFMFKKNIGGNQRLLECGNFGRCPLLKDKLYQTYNFVPDKSRLPPLLPSGRYKMEIQGLYHDEELWLLNTYIKIHRPFDKK